MYLERKKQVFPFNIRLIEGRESKSAAKGIFEMDNKLNEVLNHFAIQPEVSSYGNGHINDTYIVHSWESYFATMRGDYSYG